MEKTSQRHPKETRRIESAFVGVALPQCEPPALAPDVFALIGCTTFSRDREIAAAWAQRPMQPSCATGAVCELPDLPEHLQSRVDSGNALVDFTLAEISILSRASKGTALENHTRSWLWQFGQLENIRQAPGLRRIEYDENISGSRRKRQRIKTNIAAMQMLVAACRHVHDAADWEPRGGQLATRAEA